MVSFFFDMLPAFLSTILHEVTKLRCELQLIALYAQNQHVFPHQNLHNCSSTVTILSHDSPKLPDVSNLYEFGTFEISLLPETQYSNTLPTDFKECWLYLSNGEEVSI